MACVRFDIGIGQQLIHKQIHNGMAKCTGHLSPEPRSVVRGHIRKRGPDTWELAIYLGKDENGRKRYAWQTVHGSKRDAEHAAAKIVSGQLPAQRETHSRGAST